MKLDKYFHLYGRKSDVVFEEIPAPKERKKGKWIYTPTEPLGYVCSVCGKGSCRYNYCPNCGADMRREGES